MARALWTAQAIADLSSLPVATRVRIVAKVSLLESFPMMGLAMDGPYEGFRQIIAGRTRVIYQVGEDGDVRIAYIRHGARQLGLRLVSDDDD